MNLATSLILLMWLVYIVGIQYKRGGWWRLVAPVTFSAFVLDVILNYSLFALLMWAWPQKGEITFSKHLGRLQFDAGWRGKIARFVEKYMLGPYDPDGYHIKPRLL